MSWRKMLFGISVGLLAGLYISKNQLSHPLTAEQALKRVKKTLSPNGKIEGAWIHITTEELHKSGITYHVYRGGITQNVNGETKCFDFVVDANTGTILDIADVS